MRRETRGRWKVGTSIGGFRRILVLLCVAVVASPTAAGAEGEETRAVLRTETMTVQIGSSLGEGDFLYQTDGGTPRLAGSYQLGALSGGGEASSGPWQTGLVKVQTHCLELDGAYTYGYHCFHVYKPGGGDGDPNYKYRIGWWTGSSKAKCCNDLFMVRDQAWVPDTGPPSEQVTNWKPTGTSYPPEGCKEKTLSLSVMYAGGSVSVSSKFQTCAEIFGLDSVGPKHFFFKWEGEKDKDWWVGMGGGLEWRFKEGTNGWKMDLGLQHTYCVPDWLCQN